MNALAERLSEPYITGDKRLYNAVHEHLDWVLWIEEYLSKMPTIFDNIAQSLSDALRVTLNQADKADFCVGYFNLRGWGKISDLVAARFDGQGKNCVRILVGMHRPPKVTAVQTPPAGSAAQEARQILGAGVEVVAAFQNISHEHLLHDKPFECAVLVTGTSKEARAEVLKLVEAAGLTGWDAGPLENSVVVEGLTSVLININKQYGSTHAGIIITGVSQPHL